MPPIPAAAAPATTSSTELPNPFGAETKTDASAVPPAAPAASPDTPGAPLAVAPAATPGPVAPAQAAPAAAAPVAAEPAAAVPTAALQLTYRGPSWTEIRDRDGVVLISRLVAAGSAQSIRGNAPFDIVIGNANAVTLLLSRRADRPCALHAPERGAATPDLMGPS